MHGRVSLARLVESLALVDPDACTGRLAWLFDFSDADLDLTNNEIVQLALTVAEYRKASTCRDIPCKVAMIVQGDTNYGIGRMIQAYASMGDVTVHVTRCANDAHTFLAAW